MDLLDIVRHRGVSTDAALPATYARIRALLTLLWRGVPCPMGERDNLPAPQVQNFG